MIHTRYYRYSYELLMPQFLTLILNSRLLTLGFATEFLFLSQLFHNTVSNISSPDANANPEKITRDHRENKMVTLIGDLLITKLFTALSSLENSQVTETMMLTLAQLSENSFVNDTNDIPAEFNKKVCCDTINMETLFRNAFKCAVTLLGHTKEIQDTADKLGQEFGKTYKVLLR